MTSLLRYGRRRLAVAASVLLTAGGLAVLSGPAPARADDANTLTVVGTSDVFDSALVQSVIKPDFEAANPGVTLNYVSRGTGAAITFAKAGTASALIVHAASLENQFVADGYSSEPYGRAIFWGDYVLAGPASDPAGVLANAPQDIVTAFERIAAAGANGQANFISRGGTPGTTVQEHAIWALTDGVPTCDVTAGNGGGEAPSTATGTCPTTNANPSWYETTGQTQGPNILTASSCNGFESSSCYVFTDRGTFNYLQSTQQATNLKILTRDNDVAGQEDLLINSFHAYGINEQKFADNPNVQINTEARDAFLEFITSPEEQERIGEYLNGDDGEAGDPPFIPSASPAITLDQTSPATVDAGKRITVTGKIENVTPGTPALANQEVTLKAVPTGSDATPQEVASTMTDSEGNFTLRDRPDRSYDYTVTTDLLTQVENADLDPDFVDLLSPASVDAGTTELQSAVSLDSATPLKKARGVRVAGSLAPDTVGTGAKLVLLASKNGGKFTRRGATGLPAAAESFSQAFRLGKGTWRVKVQYRNGTFALPSTSGAQRVTIR